MHYKLKYIAKLEFENDGPFGDAIAVHQGDWGEISSTISCGKNTDGWGFYQDRDSRVDVINASNPLLLSQWRDASNVSFWRATANPCLNNLRQIDAAANQFALEKGKRTGDPIDFPNDLTPYIKKTPVCPAGGTYSLKRVGEDSTCSIGSPHSFH